MKWYLVSVVTKTRTRYLFPKRVIASQKAATPLKAPEGGVRSFTFDLEVQPILDRACIACHNGEGKAFDLRGGKKDKLGYGTSYLNIHPYVHRQGGEGIWLFSSRTNIILTQASWFVS